VCGVWAQKDSPKICILTKLKSKNNSPRQPNNNEKNHIQNEYYFPSENELTKSPAASCIVPRLMAAVENIAVERKDCPGSDLACLVCDGTTKDSPSFDCHQC